MTNKEIIKEIKCILEELSYEDAVSYLTQNDKTWLEENIKALEQEPCENCVSRADALKVINKMNIPEDMSVFEIKSHIGVEIGTLTPVTPQPKTGHWIHLKHNKGKCSECHDVVLIAQMYGNANYCPNCGARMVKSNMLDIPTGSESEET